MLRAVRGGSKGSISNADHGNRIPMRVDWENDCGWNLSEINMCKGSGTGTGLRLSSDAFSAGSARP